jgi:hypothetical protein
VGSLLNPQIIFEVNFPISKLYPKTKSALQVGERLNDKKNLLQHVEGTIPIHYHPPFVPILADAAGDPLDGYTSDGQLLWGQTTAKAVNSKPYAAL